MEQPKERIEQKKYWSNNSLEFPPKLMTDSQISKNFPPRGKKIKIYAQEYPIKLHKIKNKQ